MSEEDEVIMVRDSVTEIELLSTDSESEAHQPRQSPPPQALLAVGGGAAAAAAEEGGSSAAAAPAADAAGGSVQHGDSGLAADTPDLQQQEGQQATPLRCASEACDNTAGMEEDAEADAAGGGVEQQQQQQQGEEEGEEEAGGQPESSQVSAVAQQGRKQQRSQSPQGRRVRQATSTPPPHPPSCQPQQLLQPLQVQFSRAPQPGAFNKADDAAQAAANLWGGALFSAAATSPSHRQPPAARRTPSEGGTPQHTQRQQQESLAALKAQQRLHKQASAAQQQAGKRDAGAFEVWRMGDGPDLVRTDTCSTLAQHYLQCLCSSSIGGGHPFKQAGPSGLGGTRQQPGRAGKPDQQPPPPAPACKSCFFKVVVDFDSKPGDAAQQQAGRRGKHKGRGKHQKGKGGANNTSDDGSSAPQQLQQCQQAGDGGDEDEEDQDQDLQHLHQQQDQEAPAFKVQLKPVAALADHKAHDLIKRMHTLTRVERVSDLCHPCCHNPILQLEDDSSELEQLMVVAAQDIPANTIVGLYFGSCITQAEDEASAGGDLSYAYGQQHSFIVEFDWPPVGQLGGLVCYGDASTCRAALINDRRAWGADASLWGERPRACKRAGRPECSCARYAGPDGRGRPANVEFVHLLYRSPASGALAPVILAKTTRDLAAGDELLTDYEAQRCSSYFPIVAENALSYSYCRLLERLGELAERSGTEVDTLLALASEAPDEFSRAQYLQQLADKRAEARERASRVHQQLADLRRHAAAVKFSRLLHLAASVGLDAGDVNGGDVNSSGGGSAPARCGAH